MLKKVYFPNITQFVLFFRIFVLFYKIVPLNDVILPLAPLPRLPSSNLRWSMMALIFRVNFF